MIRTYSELLEFDTFLERFEYLKLGGVVGEETFGYDRYLNQIFYRSPEWKKVRNEVILRDEGRDLGVEGRELSSNIFIHHMNPIVLRDIDDRNPDILNPDYLICCSKDTHNAIHYGNASLLMLEPIVRRPFDTCPWKRVE